MYVEPVVEYRRDLGDIQIDTQVPHLLITGKLPKESQGSPSINRLRGRLLVITMTKKIAVAPCPGVTLIWVKVPDKRKVVTTTLTGRDISGDELYHLTPLTWCQPIRIPLRDVRCRHQPVAVVEVVIVHAGRTEVFLRVPD